MKKRFPVYFILLLVASLGALTSWFAFIPQPSDWTNAPATTVEIQQDSLDLKTIHYDDHPQVTYTIKNTGTHPLIIKDVQTSCGCTDPHWDKRPCSSRKNRNYTRHVQAQLARTFHENDTSVM